MDNQAVLYEEIAGKGGNLGLITLNRPEVLNALDHDMVISMLTQLKKWEQAAKIKAIVIRAAKGRAFCAGGDLRSMYEKFKSHHPTIIEFFKDEYQLNRCIYHYKKPYIALLEGITMGGGVGISIYGSHCVATDQLIFAMPETGIGFFPDVGGTYFLPRIRDYIGFYLGLTGTRINIDDCVALDLIQHKIAKNKSDEIITALANQAFDENAKNTVSQVLKEFKVDTQASSLLEQHIVIKHYFSMTTMEEIFYALQTSTHSFCQEAVTQLLQKSPTSLKVTLRALQAGKLLVFDACMRQEYRLAHHFLQAHDFLEGIRALIVDKDQKPIWNPASLQEVTPLIVEEYFNPSLEELA